MHLQREITGAISSAAAKASPPVAVAGLTLFGVGLQDWVFILTGIYIIAQLAHLIWKWISEWRAKRPSNDHQAAP